MPRRPSNPLTGDCPQCGKAMTHRQLKKQKHCSRKCSSEAHYKVMACAHCGKEVRHKASIPKKYCSAACTGAARRVRGDLICEQCGEWFYQRPGQGRGRFCSTACMGRWRSENVFGSNHPLTGRKMPNRPRATATLTCPVCLQNFTVRACEAAARRTCSRACYAVYQSETRSGRHSYRWKDGRSFYYGTSWPAARAAARARDKTCVYCGISPEELGRELDVHHKVPFQFYGLKNHIQANALSNLECCCHSCHVQVEFNLKV